MASVVDATNHPIDTCLGNSLDGASLSDCKTNDAVSKNLNGFVDSLVFSDEEARKCSRTHASNNHSKYATTTVADYSDDANNNNDTNEQQSKITLRSIYSLEDMERRFE